MQGSANMKPERVRSHAKQSEHTLTVSRRAHQTEIMKHRAKQRKGPKTNVPCALQTAQGTSGITGIRKQQAKRAALSKAEQLPAQLPADLANDGVDEGGLGHLELASRHERDGQGNQPTRHDIR